MNKIVANLLSYIFQPLLMATLLFATVLWVIPSELSIQFSLENKLRLILIIFMITSVLPLISIFILKLTKGIKNYDLKNKEDRIVPFFFVAIYYAIAAYLLTTKITLGPLFDTLILTTAFVVILSSIVTPFWKISVHSMGTAGVLGFMIGMNFNSPDSLFYWPIFLWVLITGFTMSSRLFLNAHEPAEVWGGAVVGFGICFLTIVLFIR